MLSANAVPKCKGLMHTAKQPEITLHGATFSSVCVCVCVCVTCCPQGERPHLVNRRGLWVHFHARANEDRKNLDVQTYLPWGPEHIIKRSS